MSVWMYLALHSAISPFFGLFTIPVSFEDIKEVPTPGRASDHPDERKEASKSATIIRKTGAASNIGVGEPKPPAAIRSVRSPGGDDGSTDERPPEASREESDCLEINTNAVASVNANLRSAQGTVAGLNGKICQNALEISSLKAEIKKLQASSSQPSTSSTSGHSESVVVKWSTSNGLRLNFSKCFIILFSRRRILLLFDYSMGDSPLQRTSLIRDLGRKATPTAIIGSTPPCVGLRDTGILFLKKFAALGLSRF
ncbi:hypothetical protein TSAR_015043 [Trichomalopsis sarcophagae]|uniref:Uncharacterized protein n=1 Tax=Trichomalopsis sarcophagae TaxID=543379 RepID=A0A232F9T4_9HYME|nr:hypothetical protein TSAR_015043 [Trichomalopsis sarcophagae]